MARLRVALLTPCYWPEVLRGTERIANDLARGLLARGHQPTLITSHRSLPRRALEDGVRVIRVPRPPQGFLVRRGYEAYMTHVPLSYLALRGGPYDLAHALYPTDALAAARWRRKTGGPAVLSYMGVPEHAWLTADRCRLQILRRAVEDCDAVITLSRHAASVMRSSIGHDPEVIYPGVDLEAFQPIAARAARPTVLCTAAVEVERKNVALLIEAFSLLRQRHDDARLVLVRPQDPAAARRAGVSLNVPGLEWIGHGPDAAALAAAYSEAWVAVLPAVGEAFGLVLVEALACGTPVVGFAGGGIPEIIDRPAVGRLFHRLEAEDLAVALERVLELSRDPGIAAACRARAAEFSSDRTADRHVELYNRLACGS
jgi:phosphatidyl-myo-inositol alpha-mannosyltransferase